MISEREFSSFYTSSWRDLCPNAESVIRTLNMGAERFEVPEASPNSPDRRDLIAESGFCLFEAGWLSDDGSDNDTDALERARARISSYRRAEVSPLDEFELAEANRLRGTITQFLIKYGSEDITLRPTFKGCGVVDRAEGDVLAGESLIEVKYVDRRFRSSDLKQCLIYLALNHAEKNRRITRLVLCNAYAGVFVDLEVDTISVALSGRSSRDLFDELIGVASSGEVSK